MDIKPQNLLFSNERKKIVLIDFGFSKIVAEEVGLKSRSSFSGSIGYCSPEIRKMFSNKK